MTSLARLLQDEALGLPTSRQGPLCKRIEARIGADLIEAFRRANGYARKERAAFVERWGAEHARRSLVGDELWVLAYLKTQIASFLGLDYGASELDDIQPPYEPPPGVLYGPAEPPQP